MLPEAEFAFKRIPLARFLTSFVLYALWVGLSAWLVSMLKAFTHPSGSLWKRIALAPLALASSAIIFIVHAVGHALSYSVSHSMPSVAHWMNALATREIAFDNALANFATQTAVSFERLVGVTIPHEIHRATVRIYHGIDQLTHEQAALRTNLRHFERGIDRLLRDNIMPRVRATERAVGIAIPREIGHIRTRTGALERTVNYPSATWVKRIWKYGWLLVGAGLMVKFLVRKFPHLFCRNTTRGLKALCGLPSSLVDVLLGDALAAIVLLDICDTIKAIELVGDQFEPIIRGLVVAEDDFFDHCGHDIPSAADPPGYGGTWLATNL